VTTNKHSKIINEILEEKQAIIDNLNETIEGLRNETFTYQPMQSAPVTQPTNTISMTEHRRQMAEIEEERNQALAKAELYGQLERDSLLRKEAYNGNIKSFKPLEDTI
jgi:hypothetical protein